MPTTIATAVLWPTWDVGAHRTTGKLSDGSYFLLGGNRQIYWTKDQGANWSSKLTLTSLAWVSPAMYALYVLADTIYIIAVVQHWGEQQPRFWRVTYNPATETFTASVSNLEIRANTTHAQVYRVSIGVHSSGGRVRSFWDSRSAYSDNGGSLWTQMSDGTWTANYAVLPRGGDLVLVGGGTGSSTADVFTPSATTWPTRRLSSVSVADNYQGGCALLDPDTSDIYVYGWDQANRRMGWQRFSGDTWSGRTDLTPTHRPSATGLYLYAQGVYVNGQRHLVYTWHSDTAPKVAYLTNESASSVQIVAPGVALSHLTATPDMGGASDSLLIAIYRESSTGTIKSETVIFNLPPDPPVPQASAGFDARDPARFTWTFSDPDAGDSQSAFKLRLREQGTGTWYYAQADGTLTVAEGWLTSSNEYWDLAADILTNGKTYEWQVATKDAAGVEGPYCDAQTFDTAIPPAKAIIVSPAHNHDVVTAPQQFRVRAESNDGAQLHVRLQLDTAATFDTGNLIELLSDPQDSGTEHVFSQALLGTQTWYWRARAERDEAEPEVSDWTVARNLNVDTGGAVPASILPDPEGGAIALPNDFLLAWSAVLDHALTPTASATLRLQVQIDTSEEFAGPETATSARASGGQRASVSGGVTAPGVYWVRLRTLADYGNDSAWATYQITVTVVTPFVRDPQWRAQTGPRPNRVYVRIAGTSTIKTAEVGGVAASAKVDHWVEVPSGTSEAEAQNTANAILAVLQGRPVSVSGPVALTVAAGFDRLVIAQWWEIDPATGGRVKREEHAGLVLAKKVHNIDDGTTELHLGDYTPPPEETLARILAKLSRP